MAKKPSKIDPVAGVPAVEVPEVPDAEVPDAEAAPVAKKPRAAPMAPIARFYCVGADGRKFPTSRRRDDRLKGAPDGKVSVDGEMVDAWRSGSKVPGGAAENRASYVWFRARGALVFVTSNVGEVLAFESLVLTTVDGAGPDGPPKASGKPRDSGWPEPKKAVEPGTTEPVAA